MTPGQCLPTVPQQEQPVLSAPKYLCKQGCMAAAAFRAVVKQCLAPQDAISPLASFGSVDCEPNAWGLTFVDEQPYPWNRPKPLPCGGVWSHIGSGVMCHQSPMCKLCAFKLFGLPGCWQGHSLKLFQLKVQAFIYSSALTEVCIILSGKMHCSQKQGTNSRLELNLVKAGVMQFVTTWLC